MSCYNGHLRLIALANNHLAVLVQKGKEISGCVYEISSHFKTPSRLLTTVSFSLEHPSNSARDYKVRTMNNGSWLILQRQDETALHCWDLFTRKYQTINCKDRLFMHIMDDTRIMISNGVGNFSLCSIHDEMHLPEKMLIVYEHLSPPGISNLIVKNYLSGLLFFNSEKRTEEASTLEDDKVVKHSLPGDLKENSRKKCIVM